MRKIVKIISYALALILVLGVFSIKQVKLNEDLKLQLNNFYSKAIATLDESFENISIELKKCKYFTDPEQLENVARNLTVNANIAKNALSALPSDSANISEINKFLSQVGDYTSIVANASISGSGVDLETLNNIQTLSQIAEKIYNSVSGIIAENSIDNDLLDANENELPDSSEDITQTLSDYPTLIYDGPFSDHILTGESELLKKSEELSQEFCRKIAANLLNVDESAVADSGEQQGKISGYRFMCEDTELLITKMGGYLAFMRKFSPEGNKNYSPEQCIELAKNFLSKAYPGNFLENYFIINDGMCLINFAYVEGNCVCYTDLIKVGISTTSGEVLFFEADGYIMNHKPRTIITPQYSESDAKSVLSEFLTPIRTQQVIVPSDGKMEINCYEFLCSDELQNQVLMYINTATLKEERLFLVYDTPSGNFTK